MGVHHSYFVILGVPAESLVDPSGRKLLDVAREHAAEEYEDEADQDVAEHLDQLLSSPLHAYEGATFGREGQRRFIVGKAVLKLEQAKGLLGWDLAGPLREEDLAAARKEVTEALAQLHVTETPRVILLSYTF